MTWKVYSQNTTNMMTELSLHVLDIANNSIRANATLIEIYVKIHKESDKLTIIIADNGCGMTEEQLSKAEDPFFTTRITRPIGLGIPFFKMAALSTGGSFTITSAPGEGTKVTAEFCLSHIDRMPLGDMTSTLLSLITSHAEVDFIYTYVYEGKKFRLDTREFREVLGDVPLNSPQVSVFIKEYLEENKREVDGGYEV